MSTQDVLCSGNIDFNGKLYFFAIVSQCLLFVFSLDHDDTLYICSILNNVWNLILRSAALIITVLYLSLLYGLHVPDWEYQIPGDSSSTPKTFSVSFDHLFFNCPPISSSMIFFKNYVTGVSNSSLFGRLNVEYEVTQDQHVMLLG